jgi:hypothetical protein
MGHPSRTRRRGELCFLRPVPGREVIDGPLYHGFRFALPVATFRDPFGVLDPHQCVCDIARAVRRRERGREAVFMISCSFDENKSGGIPFIYKAR